MASSSLVNYSPGRVLLVSFGFVIIVGTFLLSMPQAREVSIPFIDILFTAASTTCVTGLSVVPISHFTFFGQCVLLALTQIGGLGLMTLSFFLVSLVLNLGMGSRLMAGQLLEFQLWNKVRSFLFLIGGLTLGCELIGAALLYIPFSATLNSSDAMFYAIIHSVAAFGNAGISLFEQNMIVFNQYPSVLLILSGLIIAGGLGFVVWYEFLTLIKRFIDSMRGKSVIYNISLHTKLVVSTTLILLIVGTVLIWLIEWFHAFREMSFFTSVVNSFFLATSARSAGFANIDFSSASHATLLVLLVLMFIGSSPGSTGAGIKTTTFALFIINLVAIFRNRRSIELFGRTIPAAQIYKVMGIVAAAVSWILVTTFVLLVMERSFTFIEILFETVSAFATCGYSLGITPTLGIASKCVLILTMIIGRIGSLTLVLALRTKAERPLFRYPEERVIIG